MVGRFVVVLIAAAVFGAGTIAFQSWSRQHAPLHQTDLTGDPAFVLRMPGSDELAEVGDDGRVGIDGSTRTFAGHIFGTAAMSEDVYSFYTRELIALGWRPDTPPFASSSAELENRQYCKAKATFRLAIKNKDTAFEPTFYRGRVYVTVFDATLLAVDPSTPCPRPGIGSPGPSR